MERKKYREDIKQCHCSVHLQLCLLYVGSSYFFQRMTQAHSSV